MNNIGAGITDGFSLCDSKLILIEINEAGLNMFPDGTKKEDIIGKNFADIVPDLKENGRYEKFIEVINTGIPYFEDDIMPPASFGGLTHLNLKAFKVGDGIGIMVTDVTKQMLAEEKWLLFMKSATDNFSLYDSNLNMVEINHIGLSMFPEGTKKEDIIGKNLSELVSGLYGTERYERLKRVIDTGKPYSEDDIVPPSQFGEDRYLNIKAFKVGDGLGLITSDNTERKLAEKELRRHQNHLEELVEERTFALEEANTTLEVLLKKREKDKNQLEEDMLFNVRELVMPYLEKIKTGRLDERQNIYFNILESNLNDIISPFVRSLSSKYLKLTPSEIRTSNLIRQGKTTKEIAELLRLSYKTIETHRRNIRKKIGLTNKKTNLTVHLQSIHE